MKYFYRPVAYCGISPNVTKIQPHTTDRKISLIVLAVGEDEYVRGLGKLDLSLTLDVLQSQTAKG